MDYFVGLDFGTQDTALCFVDDEDVTPFYITLGNFNDRI